MEVLHVSFSSSGGAGRVASILCEEQRRRGQNSGLLVLSESNLWSSPLKFLPLTLRAAFDKYVVAKKGNPALLSCFRAKYTSSSIKTQILNSGADVIHLHWITGLLDKELLAGLAASGKRVVWTLHDMEPMTGGCHHALECQQYGSGCSKCPQVRSIWQGSIAQNLEAKVREYKHLQQITFTVPSNWMLDRAKASLALKTSDVRLVSNPVSPEYLKDTSQALPQTWPIGYDHVIALACANLTDPLKSVEMVCDLMPKLIRQIDGKVALVLVGNNGELFNSPSDSIFWLGALQPLELAAVLRKSDMTISASIGESFSLVTAEALALGTFTVVRKGTAAEELVNTFGNGATFKSGDDLHDVIKRHLRDKKSVGLGQEIADALSLNLIADKFEEIYREKIKSRN